MQSSVFALGELAAVLINVVGAALLVLELSGRTIAFSRPYIRPNRFHWSAVSVATAGVGAAVFVVGLASLGNIIVIIPGFVSINPTRGLEAVFGLLFGLPGVAAGMIGNPIGDVLTGKLSLGSFAGCITHRTDKLRVLSRVPRQSWPRQFHRNTRVGPLRRDDRRRGDIPQRARDRRLAGGARADPTARCLVRRIPVDHDSRGIGQCGCGSRADQDPLPVRRPYRSDSRDGSGREQTPA